MLQGITRRRHRPAARQRQPVFQQLGRRHRRADGHRSPNRRLRRRLLRQLPPLLALSASRRRQEAMEPRRQDCVRQQRRRVHGAETC